MTFDRWFRGSRAALLAAAALALGAGAARAQDSTLAPAPALPRTLAQASWISDRVPLRPGDLLTVVVVEQTSAREQVSQVAEGSRSQKGTMDATVDGDVAFGATRVAMGLDGRSRDVGEARRAGDLNGVVTVRVTEITPEGLARIQGEKKVTVDGRPQTVSVKGLVRPADVGAGRRVLSSRVADAEIVYTGKKIAPRTGFFGKLLGMLWP